MGERVLNDLEHVQPSVLFSQLTGVATSNFLSAAARTPPAVNDLAGCRSRIASVQGAVLSLSPARVARLGSSGAAPLSRHLSAVLLPPVSAPHRPPPGGREGAGEGTGRAGGRPLRLRRGRTRERSRLVLRVLLVFLVLPPLDRLPQSRVASPKPTAAPTPSSRPQPRSHQWATGCTSTSWMTRKPLPPRTQRLRARRPLRPPPLPPLLRRLPVPSTSVASAHPNTGGRFHAVRLHRSSEEEGEEWAAELWSAAEMGEGEDEEEPALRMATAWQTHWPVE